MPKQIEEIFAPERLRKSWEKPKNTMPGETLEQTNKNAPMAAFDALGISLQERFYGDNLAVLNLLMDSLQPFWESLFADDPQMKNPVADAEEMIAAAYELLNQIEDLSFAFSFDNRAKNT